MISAIGLQMAAMVLFIYAMTIPSEIDESGNCENSLQSTMTGLGLFLNLLAMLTVLMICGGRNLENGNK